MDDLFFKIGTKNVLNVDLYSVVHVTSEMSSSKVF